MWCRPFISSRCGMTGLVAVVTACACVAAAKAATATRTPSDPAAALRARYLELREQLDHSPFPRHLHVESMEGPGASQGDVYVVVDYPIAAVSDAFANPANWCDALILHINVKYCRRATRDGRTVLSTAIGRSFDQPLSSTYRVDFVYGIPASRPDYMNVDLAALEGPIGTGNYRISLEAVGLPHRQSFMHLRYSYTYGFAGRLAMKTYLATSGSEKVGFTVIGDPNDPQRQYIGGVRGAIERNTMRYYLAIDAYLAARAVPVPERLERSLERWFSGTELYPRQLREMDRNTYLAMKRSEYARQQTAQ